MKKIMILLMVMGLFLGGFGCATTGTNTPPNIDLVVDLAFTAFLIERPELKPEVVAALKETKILLATPISFATLTQEIATRFGGKYAPLIVIIQGYIDTDKPVCTDLCNMFDAQKAEIVKKLDRLIMLASV
jgi:hypothetical protein